MFKPEEADPARSPKTSDRKFEVPQDTSDPAEAKDIEKAAKTLLAISLSTGLLKLSGDSVKTLTSTFATASIGEIASSLSNCFEREILTKLGDKYNNAIGKNPVEDMTEAMEAVVMENSKGPAQHKATPSLGWNVQKMVRSTYRDDPESPAKNHHTSTPHPPQDKAASTSTTRPTTTATSISLGCSFDDDRFSYRRQNDKSLTELRYGDQAPPPLRLDSDDEVRAFLVHLRDVAYQVMESARHNDLDPLIR